MEASSSRDDSPHETDGYISDGLRAMELAAEGLLHHEQREPRGGERRRGMDGGCQGGRDGVRAGRQYRPLPHGGDGDSSGLVYTPAIRAGNTASGTSGGEYIGDSARRSRTRGRRAHGGLDSPRSRSASDRDLRYAVGSRYTSRRAAGGSVSAVSTAACPAMALPAVTGEPRRGRGPAMGTGRGTVTSVRGSRTPPVTAARRRGAPPGAGPPTPTSARSSWTLLAVAASSGLADSRCHRL